MIPDALCSVCHRAHPAETLDALARCSTCIHDLGVADTIRPPARSPQASADCSREGCDRPAHPGAPMCIAHWTETPTAARARWGLGRPEPAQSFRGPLLGGGCPMIPADAIADCTPVVLLELVTDPRDAGLCDCGEREPADGSDACDVCDGEAVL